MTCKQLTVGIVGLGLIGGSMARTYAAAGHKVLAAETDSKTQTKTEMIANDKHYRKRI
jgi:prephenate dehydrogenase